MNPVLSIESLLKTYGAETATPVQALCGVTFALASSEFVAIMGHSGSGKSTLLNLLGCLDRPTSGCIRLRGNDLSRQTRRQLAGIRCRELGFVFQSFNLLPRLTIEANCELPLLYSGLYSRNERRERVETALERVGLKHKLGRKPTELSGGQQQRVAIARALVNRPALLLADEPTGNLDTHTALEVMAVLQELNRQGLTIILVTHEADIAACASRVITLRDGRVFGDTVNAAPVQAALEKERIEMDLKRGQPC